MRWKAHAAVLATLLLASAAAYLHPSAVYATLASGGQLQVNPSSSGSGCTPAGSSGQVLTDDGAGGCASNATIPNTSVAATPSAAGGDATLVGPRMYYECTGTCTVTLPTPPAAGTVYEFCIRNANNVATVITMAGIASVQFEVQAQTSYKSANTSIVAGGAVTDKVCWRSKDATHYDIGVMVGTWS